MRAALCLLLLGCVKVPPHRADAMRAAVLRMLGYRVDVVEFVDSKHTPRNAMLRAVRTGAPAGDDVVADYRALTEQWHVTPYLADALRDELRPVLGAS